MGKIMSYTINDKVDSLTQNGNLDYNLQLIILLELVLVMLKLMKQFLDTKICLQSIVVKVTLQFIHMYIRKLEIASLGSKICHYLSHVTWNKEDGEDNRDRY